MKKFFKPSCTKKLYHVWQHEHGRSAMKRIVLVISFVFLYFPVHADCILIGGDVNLALSHSGSLQPSESWYLNSFTVTKPSVISFTYGYSSDEFSVWEWEYCLPSSEWARFTVSAEDSYPANHEGNPNGGNLWFHHYIPTYLYTFIDPNTGLWAEQYQATYLSEGISIDLSPFLGQTIAFGWTFCQTDGGPGAYGQWELSNVSINEIPEPSTIFLFGISILGLAGISRRKK